METILEFSTGVGDPTLGISLGLNRVPTNRSKDSACLYFFTFDSPHFNIEARLQNEYISFDGFGKIKFFIRKI